MNLNPILRRSSWMKSKRDTQEKLARLEQAEQELRDLHARRVKADRILTARKRHNHWRESIELMIHGGRT